MRAKRLRPSTDVEKPTLAEIKRRAAAIRERWTPEETERRSMHLAGTRRHAGVTLEDLDTRQWQPPTVSTQGLIQPRRDDA